MSRLLRAVVLAGLMGCGVTAGEPKAAKAAIANAPKAAPAVDASVAKAFLADCAAKDAAAEKAELMTVKGKDGWLFFGPDLH